MWVVLLQVALAACLLSPSVAYFFESGYTHHYTYWAENTLQDQHNITTVLKFQIHAVNETEERHHLHALTVDSLVQYVKDGVLMDNPLKWDLSKTFLFMSDDKGSVTLVHSHPEDHEELLVIKKAMVSVFSVHVQIADDKEKWTYHVDEKDHLGDLHHEYKAHRTSSGLKLHRKHSSENEAFREHEKVLHYDGQGTLHVAEAKDHVWVKDRSSKNTQSQLPGEKPHLVVTSGDFPVISSSASVKVTLEGKRPQKLISPPVFHNLTSQTLQTVAKPPPKYLLTSVEKNITQIFECLRQFPEKESENRSICVNDLRRVLQGLYTEDFITLVNRIFGNGCQDNDTVCEDRHLIFIDILSRIGDKTSQDLLISHILSKMPPVDEELRRVFIHCAALENPTELFVQWVERFCFGAEGEHHGSRAMTRTQSRACLAVGSLARHSHRAGQQHTTDRLLDRLESWLDRHAEGDPHVSKRDTWLEETEHEDHHVSKAVLLHALGNAAMPRSQRHLLLHATPNRGHHMWRRAALDALRHYNCTETAKVMLECLMHDDMHTVRRAALAVFVKHPQRRDVSTDYENVILSQNYTYPAVARVKRDIFDKVLLKFKLALPKLDWKKEIGDKAVGASFGVLFENSIDALFRVLSGYVDVNVHDKVWAEIHLGIIHKQWDLLLAEICYKGRLSYNMNLIKDYTVGLFKDISSAFDHIASRIIEPMEKTANELAQKYQNASTSQPKSGFEPLSAAVKELPLLTESAVNATSALSEATESMSGLPLVTKLQQLAARAQSLMEDVHTEATDLFANIKDVAVVVLPFSEKEIRQSLNTILSKLGEVSKAPRQVFSFIERARMSFTLAMQRVLEGHNVIKESTAFLSGSRSSFLSTAHELEVIASTTRLLLPRLKAEQTRRKRDANRFELDEFGQDVGSELAGALDVIYISAEKMANEVTKSISSAQAVQKGLDQQANYVEILKNSYQAFKESIDMVKSRISALIGQKFYRTFPEQRRDCDDKCGCGYYPTDCKRYGHPGVELKLDPGWKIVSPVAGIASLLDNHTISIKPVTPGFTDYDIILANILLSVTLDSEGTFVDAGQVLGTPVGNNGCEVSHFHLSMKRGSTSAGSEDLCYYVDPSPFLDHMQPIPRWQQECKEFTFKHIRAVVDFSSLTEGFSVLVEELKRFAVDVGKQLVMKVVNLLPDTGFLGTMKHIAGDIVSNIDLNASNLKNLVKNAIKNNMKGFLINIATKNFNMERIMKMASKVVGNNQFLNNSIHRVTNLIGKAQNFIRNPPIGILKAIPVGAIGRLLSSHGVMAALPAGLASIAGQLAGSGADDTDKPSFGQGCMSDSGLGSLVESGVDRVESMLVKEAGELGAAFGPEGSLLFAGATSEITSFVSGRTGMVTALKTSVCKMCESFGNALSRLSHSACVAHEDCLGIDCNVAINNRFVRAKVDFKLKVFPEERKFTLTVDGEEQSVYNSTNQTVIPKLTILKNINVKFKFSATWQEKELHLHLGVVGCWMSMCLRELPILRDLKFGGHRRKQRSADEFLGHFLSHMDSLPVDDIAKTFSDFSLPMKDMVDQISGIQEQILSSLSPNENQANATLDNEFENPTDHQDKGQFPLQGQNKEVFIPFFQFLFFYQLGPLTFTMYFDAGGCIGLSFDIKVQALDSILTTEVKPWVSGQFHASFNASIIIASCGVDLTGWVLKTGFPLSLRSNYSKQPLVTRKMLEIELIPIELLLKGWVKILFIINIHKTIWHYTAPAIRGTIWQHTMDKNDLGPPRFPYCDRVAEQCSHPSHTTRSSLTTIPDKTGKCNVRQVLGRHPKDPAFHLQFTAEDEDSDLHLSYAVGSYPGGTDIQNWTQMRGNSLLSPAELPCGIPLHFTAKARNSQGLESVAQCSLLTFDCTFPEGRVDASYRCSSHPRKLSARVVVFEDSPLKDDSVLHAVGYSPSSHGHEVLDWKPLQLSNSQPQTGVTGSLSQFSPPRPGRLITRPLKTLKTSSAALCASQCLSNPTCMSFSYQQFLQDCELQQVVEGVGAERKASENFVTYERFGKSYTAFLSYDNLPLHHGTQYYINVDVQNVLDYQATLTSEGTMVDMTPPEPGPVVNVISDNITAGGCQVSILQRCEEHVTGSLNHRKIIDGPGSRTVFTGSRKGQEMSFTMENYQAAANWDGFKDEECGIHGYTWAVGTSVCGTDVVGFVDPHTSIHNPDDWTYTGLARNLLLADGPYYVTVQAVSDVIHGGDLVTTICHSSPFVVDTTPPDFNSVKEFLFDEGFCYLVVYYDVSDVTSGIGSVELGLGKTKYDVLIRPYLPVERRGVPGNSYIVKEEFETEDGVPAWIRLKGVNNVGLSSTGSSESPILLDSTPPVAGHVMDGTKLGQDICCQVSVHEICAQWMDFYDSDSNIESYDWGVGLTPGTDDVVTFHTLSSYDKQSCVNVSLQHNVTYFSTVVASNKALNQKSANSTSDGLLVDITPPLVGKVSDGSEVNIDVNYTSETATVTTSWAGFSDPESGLADYTLTVLVNGDVQKTFSGISGTANQFSDHSLSLEHGDFLFVQLQAMNRADSKVNVQSDGMLVDHTPPQVVNIGTENGIQFQQRDDVLNFTWQFHDAESGVEEYRCVVYEFYQGIKVKYWPDLTDYHIILLNLTSPTAESLHLQSLRLQNGAAYNIQITAINRAKMAAAEESESVTVDTTPPDVLKVKLAREDEEEELNDNGEVELVDREPVWVTWTPHDSESDITSTVLCVGLAGSPDCLSSAQKVITVDGSLPATVSLKDVNFTVSSDNSKVLYQVYMVVRNGAGMESAQVTSRPFLVLRANIAGFVLDGRLDEDKDYSNDKSSIAVTFSGFSSEACGIVGYEWGVGTSAFATDVLPYTDYGLVVDEAGKGFAQVHDMQFEGQKYYSTIRAKTGHNCHEEYIVSSSDGFILDTTPPRVSFHANKLEVSSEEVVYQTTSDYLGVLWRVEDNSGVNDTRLIPDVFSSSMRASHVDAEPAGLLLMPIKLASGDSLLSALIVTDMAGNEMMSFLPLITLDTTPPVFQHLSCSPVVSLRSSLLSCSWMTLDESHSRLADIQIGLGNGPSAANLMTMTSLPLYSSSWSTDVNDIIRSSASLEFYVILWATNEAGFKTSVQLKVLIDNSPPVVEDVRIVTSPEDGFHDARQICQTSEDYIEVLIVKADDEESGVKSVELALGSSKGRSDIKAFHQYPLQDGLYIMGRLALSRGTTVYVTARVTNNVGVYVIASSQGVVVSPEPRLQVSDGAQEADVDGQQELQLLQGRWSYSDPCPVLFAEWSVQELGGKLITNFTHIPDNGPQFYNDTLRLENFKTYINYVRIRDALNRTRTAFSDGVTVFISQPDTAVVRDGLGDNDDDFQESTDTLSAKWDPFGNARSTLPSDQIIRYEVALGTDRRFFNTRSDIHAFENVRLDTNVTFYGLNLTAKTQVYYVTVRAYSAAGSYVESSSDGISVGFSSEVTAGFVHVAEYQSSTSNVRFAWDSFDSDMTITFYYAGISTHPPPFDNSTYECSHLLKNSQMLFDVYQLQVLQTEGMAVISHLSLKHGDIFHVTVVAVNNMNQCSATVSKAVLVDVTPPLKGNVTVEGFDANTVLFLHSADKVIVNLAEFSDPESGVHNVKVDLLTSQSCSLENASRGTRIIASVDAKNQSVVAIRNLDLQEDKLYFLQVTVTNGADLETKAVSRPVLLDLMPPLAGVVKLSNQWREAEQTYRPQTDSVQSLVALQSLHSQLDCITQINLLAEDTKKEWSTLGGDFTASCVGFDDSGLHVLVQHNPYLSGVDKGAVQFSTMAWREGDYKFRLTPAAGDHIMTGISLASPSLQPPFYVQNEIVSGNLSALPCDWSVELCLEDRKQNMSEGSMQSDADYGTGLTFMQVNGKIKLLFWAQDNLNQLKHSWIALGFDPASGPADYTLNLKRRIDTGTELWEVSVLVNGQSKSSVSGLVFPSDLVLTVYSWNIGGFFPPVTDVYQPFRADTVFHLMSLPVAQRPLCSYGAAFSDAVSGIKELWMGVSDSYNDTANVAPFKQLKAFRLPCLQHCAEICANPQEEPLSGDFVVFPLELHNLLLHAADQALISNVTSSDNSTANNSTADELHQYKLPTYYVDIRVVDHSGLATYAKSNGLVVDTSPPTIKSMQCFDPRYFKDVEIFFLGNNHTVGVTWDASEDVSGIRDVWVSLGTQPSLDDVSSKTLVNKTRNDYIFTDISPPLQEAGVYFITVEVNNEASLSSQAWRNFTVHTIQPDLSMLTLHPANVTTRLFGAVTVGLMENSENLTFYLYVDPHRADDMDVEYYEWAIGTSEGKDDVFPRTVIGKKHIKKVAIVHGYILRDESSVKISVGDYAQKNYSSNDPPDPSANKFAMEPGRCLKLKLYGVSKAHVATAFDIMPLCIKRTNDVIIEGDGQSHVLQQNRSSFTLDASSADADALTIQVKLNTGALITGVLNQSDLTASYGSSASAEFSPFIVWPDTTLDSTSRLLRQRLVEIPGPSIFLSPAVDSEFADDVSVKYKVPNSVIVTPDCTVSLLVWNPDDKQWQSPVEFCPAANSTYNNVTREVSAKLCAELFASLSKNLTSSPTTIHRRRRSSHRQLVSVSKMFSVSIVNSTIVNRPPVIDNTSFTIQEDRMMPDFTLMYMDPEGDKVEFQLIQPWPQHGSATLMTTNNSVSYYPNLNYNGPDVIFLRAHEIIDKSLKVKPNVVIFNLTVNVTGLNDPPDIFYLPGTNNSKVIQQLMIGPTAGNGINRTVYIESNTTTQTLLGLVVWTDVDINDNITFSSITNVSAGTYFEETDVNPSDSRLNQIKSNGPSQIVQGKEITLHLLSGHSGYLFYAARARDVAGAFSLLLSVNVFVLLNPCFHGNCQPRDQKHSCLEPQRVFTFDHYHCQCHLGYEGEWCQTEINECESATCSPITDCVDLIGAYRCDVNASKLAAIVLCSIGAVTLAVFVLYKLKKRKHKVDVWKAPKDCPVQNSAYSPPVDCPVQNSAYFPPVDHQFPSKQETFDAYVDDSDSVSVTTTSTSSTTLLTAKTLPPIRPLMDSPYSQKFEKERARLKSRKLLPLKSKPKKFSKQSRSDSSSLHALNLCDSEAQNDQEMTKIVC